MCNPVVGAKVIEPFDRFLAFINTPDNFEGLFRLAKIVGILMVKYRLTIIWSAAGAP